MVGLANGKDCAKYGGYKTWSCERMITGRHDASLNLFIDGSVPQVLERDLYGFIFILNL